MTVADLLPWLNLLLVPAVGLLLSINGRMARLEATQTHHADQLRALRMLPTTVAGMHATQNEHSRRLDALG